MVKWIQNLKIFNILISITIGDEYFLRNLSGNNLFIKKNYQKVSKFDNN